MKSETMVALIIVTLNRLECPEYISDLRVNF